MPKQMKITNAEKEIRITLIIKLLVTGLSRRDILKYVQNEAEWNVCNNMVDRYIRDATDILEDEETLKRNKIVGLAVERLNKLYAESLKIKDFKTCLAIQKELNDMFGNKAPTKSEHEINGTLEHKHKHELTDKDLEAVIRDKD